jgi:BioD-like phosphotransacetylase family protein
MNSRIALALGASIVLALGVDIAKNDMAGSIFVARKLLDLIDYLAFWR